MKIERLVETTNVPWTNIYGLARTLLALCTLTAFIGHTPQELFFHFSDSHTQAIHENTLGKYSIYYLLRDHIAVAQWGSILVLVTVIIGWRPRITGLLHWYVSYSFAASCLVVQGGDHITANLTLILLPVTLLDNRKFHWQKPHESDPSPARAWKENIAHSCFIVARIQVAVVYFFAGVSKLDVPEWLNGTAFYYWFTHPVFGAPNWLRGLLEPLLSFRPVVMTATWGPILLEVLLAAGLVAKEKFKFLLLVLGLLFHAAIALIHGLFAFFLAMSGALLVFLVRPTYHIRFDRIGRALHRRIKQVLEAQTARRKVKAEVG